MRGIRAVDKALGVFEKTRKRLTDAILRCIDEIEVKENEIAKVKAGVTDLKYAQERAQKVLDALNKILAV